MEININWKFTPAHVEILGKAINGTNTITEKEFEAFLQGIVNRAALEPKPPAPPTEEEMRQMRISNYTPAQRASYMRGWAQAGERLAKK